MKQGKLIYKLVDRRLLKDLLPILRSFKRGTNVEATVRYINTLYHNHGKTKLRINLLVGFVIGVALPYIIEATKKCIDTFL